MTNAPPIDRDEAEEPAVGLPVEDIRQVRQWIEEDERERIEAFAANLHAADLADLLEQIDPNARRFLVLLLGPKLDAEVFIHLSPSIREEVVEQIGPPAAARIVADLDSDDALDLIAGLEPDLRDDIIRHLSTRMRALVEEGLTFPEDSAGRLMQREFVAIPQFWTVGKTIDFLRAAGETVPEDFQSIFVVDPMHRVMGEVALSRILRAKRSVKIQDIADKEVDTIPVDLDQEEVALMFNRYSLVSAPVVDNSGRLIGVITIDDVVDVINEEAEEDILKLGGVGDGDIYSAVIDTTRARFSWLAVNVFTAMLAALVIGLFEATIQQIVALAVLMPIVASMGGNAGTQALTVAVRALATRELSEANALRVVAKEAMVGMLNGLMFATIVGAAAGFWFNDLLIGAVIAAAMLINLFVAGLCGAVIPILLSRLKIDPAVASSVFLTTVTDIVGFFAFLGLATLVLL